jgi:dihydroorotase
MGILNHPRIGCQHHISFTSTFEEAVPVTTREAFAPENGPRFYRLPVNENKILLARTRSHVPDMLSAASTRIIPFHAGQTLAWRFAGRVRGETGDVALL